MHNALCVTNSYRYEYPVVFTYIKPFYLSDFLCNICFLCDSANGRCIIDLITVVRAVAIDGRIVTVNESEYIICYLVSIFMRKMATINAMILPRSLPNHNFREGMYSH